ncbi:hypothetical protein [Alkalibacillus salilacus]|uniref:RsiW-degrading membrane proteinase PrsW (M82 family) n=1 Tax=Alkalibacillus salilacus TaxID=284582 RepID=A0ABT9VE16_9BACI|nr:hypothetical protein [Alkalibacillus salilacus]MDQ0159152.1 RsiW-degrading membrane proteinase PrsW (M82 family) [Alkalibacillus salilacus]
MKKTTIVSWLSLVFSIIPIFIFIAMLGGRDISEVMLFLPLVIAITLALIGITRKNEKNIIPIMSLIVSIGVGAFIFLIIVVSGMSQPT